MSVRKPFIYLTNRLCLSPLPKGEGKDLLFGEGGSRSKTDEVIVGLFSQPLFYVVRIKSV